MSAGEWIVRETRVVGQLDPNLFNTLRCIFSGISPVGSVIQDWSRNYFKAGQIIIDEHRLTLGYVLQSQRLLLVCREMNTNFVFLFFTFSIMSNHETGSVKHVLNPTGDFCISLGAVVRLDWNGV